MENVFIEKILINKVRHLENIEIDLSDENKKHLILTGKNGSGKTSVLLAIKDYLSGIENEQLSFIEIWKKNIENNLTEKSKIEKVLLDSNKNDKKNITEQKHLIEMRLESLNKTLLPYDKINLAIKSQEDIISLHQTGNLIIAFFDAKRTTQINVPSGINKVSLKKSYTIDEKINSNFLQYIVNLKADRSFSKDDNDMKTVEEIDKWFEMFENSLKDIFDDPDLKLEFDRKEFNFNILLNGREKFNFNVLSDGYSAILNIITELILRMENKASKSYDIQGIVLIDEVETHLHIDLQKKILPFLINFFPKIQFIVTTHSPFVLSSVSNAVIYDLENRLLVEDLSGYSYDGIVESYFDSDKYSEILKNKVNEYEKLTLKENLTEEEEDKYIELKLYFKELPKFMAPELELKIQQIESEKQKK